MSTVRHLGRFRMNDNLTRTRDIAEKMELARFPGHPVIVAREGADLVVYQIGDNDGLGVLVNTGDRAPKTLADLQRTYDAAYGQRETFKKRSEREEAGRCAADFVRAGNR